METAAAITLRLTTSSRRARYLAGVSSSLRSGSITDSRAICRELFLLVLEPGVAGVSDPPRPEGSEFCLNLLRLRRSPKLFRPMEDDVLTVAGRFCPSTDALGEFLPRELIVEDLPLRWRCALVGEDCPEFLELGLNNTVGGDAADFEKDPCAGEGTGAMFTPLPEEGREGVGVCWDPGLEGEPLAPEDSVKDAAREELEAERSAVRDTLGF